MAAKPAQQLKLPEEAFRGNAGKATDGNRDRDRNGDSENSLRGNNAATCGISLISHEEDCLLAEQELDNQALTGILTIKAIFQGTIISAETD